MRNRKDGMVGTRLMSIGLGLVLLGWVNQAAAQQCGSAVGGAVCANNLCCSQFGYCGSTSDYCCNGCQSQCNCGSGTSCTGGTSSGRASYYTAPYTPSACYGNDPNQFSQYFAAAGDGTPNIWDGGRNCGRFYNIQCTGNGCRNSNTISVKVVDRCPNGCVNGRAFDLSEAAFRAIADTAVGQITINYCAQ